MLAQISKPIAQFSVFHCFRPALYRAQIAPHEGLFEGEILIVRKQLEVGVLFESGFIKGRGLIEFYGITICSLVYPMFWKFMKMLLNYPGSHENIMEGIENLRYEKEEDVSLDY